ncbi:pseudouridine synthase [Amylocarpus encephaloides]|uniref:tRNA pseudouridine synthase 1 n=1 Tax=Amylocarpus encephaloides TaxID=45428 RepID=A0A9P7YA35_9HELO|nr:pseudouridine synthase [Amylocarpus encephaloides]
MADNPPPAVSVNSEGSGPSRGHGNTNSSRPNARNDRGDSRGRGRGGQGRGGRGRGRGFGANDSSGRHKKGDMGRGEYHREQSDKRKRNNEEWSSKRQRTERGGGNEYASTQFLKEEIEAEDRKPKRKVAVLIGYAGSGYKGMQINGAEKTIEGDIFKAFVAAGAISKANADDPKKSSLVRCARTDKGVHAAGNVISLKLIVEDPDIVQKINENLPPQIRVWGTERTNGSFSCYQSCDSRWYEYLIPTYSFLPPHPQSYMGKKLVESAEKFDVLEAWKSRQADVADFWDKAEETYIKPMFDELDSETREAVLKALQNPDLEEDAGQEAPKNKGGKVNGTTEEGRAGPTGETSSSIGDTETIPQNTKPVGSMEPSIEDIVMRAAEDASAEVPPPRKRYPDELPTCDLSLGKVVVDEKIGEDYTDTEASKSILTPTEAAIKRVKAAYITAKKAYRISESRKERLQEALTCYLGTRNFHNYTIQKKFSDPSAKRVIRSFKVNPKPVYINDTEWLSIKVHGQSFMMHQIRKMVAMAALVVRCGSTFDVIHDSYGPTTISIPKAPSLGLLLERPVFDSYNTQAVSNFNREKIDFDKFQKEMDEFKQQEIYDRMFREEERDHQFHSFFKQVDDYKTDFFLWVTAEGISAGRHSTARSEVSANKITMGKRKKLSPLDDASDDEPDANGQEG